MKIKKITGTAVLDGNVVDNLSDNSTTNAPSQRAVNEALLDVYSTEEIKTNKVWIDGKPIYRKVIDVTMVTTESMKSINTGITNMEICIFAYGCALYNQSTILPLNFLNADGWNSFHIANKGKTIVMQRDDTFPTTTGYIILEYTKTTD